MKLSTNVILHFLVSMTSGLPHSSSCETVEHKTDYTRLLPSKKANRNYIKGTNFTFVTKMQSIISQHQQVESTVDWHFEYLCTGWIIQQQKTTSNPVFWWEGCCENVSIFGIPLISRKKTRSIAINNNDNNNTSNLTY